MRAVVVTDYGTPEVMKYLTVDNPTMKSFQVLIRVIATSVNFADIKARFSFGTTRKERPYLLGDTANHVLDYLAKTN